MKINKFSWKLWEWKTFVIVVITFFLIIAGMISIYNFRPEPVEVDDTGEQPTFNEREFNFVSVIAGTRWVKFSDGAGGELYVYITPFGGVCEIEMSADGTRRLFASYNDFEQEINRSKEGVLTEKRKHALGGIGLLLGSSPPVFENECDLKDLPVGVQKTVLQTLYSRDLGKM